MERRFVLFCLLLLSCICATAGDNVLPRWALGGFIRPEGVNPMVRPTDATTFLCPMKNATVKWECADTFNPAAVVKDGKVCVLYRAEDDPTAGIGGRTSRIGYVESADGIHIDFRSTQPVMFPDQSQMSKTYEHPGGCEDPRIVEATVNGRQIYVMAYTAWNRNRARLAIATSTDLKTWTHHGPAFRTALDGKFKDLTCKSGSIVTAVKDGRLQAVKVLVQGKEKYLMYFGEYWVCAAVSDDLINWTIITDVNGEMNYLAKPRNGYFDSQLTECGPPAVLTEDGIILLYNGKNKSGANGDPSYPSNTYAAGQMLFSKENPLELVERLDKPFFRPMDDFEKSGQYAAGTVFVEGLVYHQDKWMMYYGCADSFVGVAVYDPATSPREGDPIITAKVPDGVINQQTGIATGKVRCFVNSCSGQAAADEGPFHMNTSYVYPSRKWCDTSAKPWVVMEFTDIYRINRIVLRDVANREDNCGNVPEWWVYVRTSTSQPWQLVAHEENVGNKGEKDVSFDAVDARYVKMEFTRGIRPSGVADNAIRLYGCDIYGEYARPIERTDGMISAGKTVMTSYDATNGEATALNLLNGTAMATHAWKPTKGTPTTDPFRYVVIDLEETYDIKRFIIWDAKSVDADAVNLNAYQISVSEEKPNLSLTDKKGDDNTCWTMVADKRNAGATSKKTVSLSTPVRGRYVKLTIPRTSTNINNVEHPTLYAFNIYGTKAEDNEDKIEDIRTSKSYTNGIFDISGKRHSHKPSKGLYILNGKKHLQQ